MLGDKVKHEGECCFDNSSNHFFMVTMGRDDVMQRYFFFFFNVVVQNIVIRYVMSVGCLIGLSSAPGIRQPVSLKYPALF